ncbi:MAG: ergothioneine biosynthesis protein EgtB [Gammaproteobacteria bacterium]
MQAQTAKSDFVVTSSTESLLDFYNRVRQDSLTICNPLETEDYIIQTMPDVSPPKWHLAHTSWFFETFLLKPHFKNYEVYHPKFEYLFNSYYEQVGTFHPRSKRGLLSRPTLETVFEYRSHVDKFMNELINDLAENTEQAIIDKITLGLNHEQQHQELLYTDILHIFASNPLQPQYRNLEHPPKSTESNVSKIQWINFDESLSEYGFSEQGFHYDNENPVHKSYVAEFKIASRLVTNAEYLEFIDDGGYLSSKYWLSDAWKIVNTQIWRHPLYWQKDNDEWFEMTLGGLRKLDMNAPVSHVSYYEADAYASWSGNRLPTEYEWERAAQNVAIEGNLRDSDYCHPVASETTDATSGLQQMYGDVWEWTQSPYVAYPGFKAATGAIGEYNGKFMSSQMILRGGSCVTPKEHIRSSYRNFFYPGDRWQFSGIRLAQNN